MIAGVPERPAPTGAATGAAGFEARNFRSQ